MKTMQYRNLYAYLWVLLSILLHNLRVSIYCILYFLAKQCKHIGWVFLDDCRHSVSSAYLLFLLFHLNHFQTIDAPICFCLIFNFGHNRIRTFICIHAFQTCFYLYFIHKYVHSRNVICLDYGKYIQMQKTTKNAISVNLKKKKIYIFWWTKKNGQFVFKVINVFFYFSHLIAFTNFIRYNFIIDVHKISLAKFQ